jgi:hypothetical protein
MKECDQCGRQATDERASCAYCGSSRWARTTVGKPADWEPVVSSFGAEAPADMRTTADGGIADGGPVTEGGRLRIGPDGDPISLPEGRQIILGRKSNIAGVAAAMASFGNVGRFHARVFLHGGRITIEDLDSVNGTFVGEVGLPTRVPHDFLLPVDIRLAIDRSLRIDPPPA